MLNFIQNKSASQAQMLLLLLCCYYYWLTSTADVDGCCCCCCGDGAAGFFLLEEDGVVESDDADALPLPLLPCSTSSPFLYTRHTRNEFSVLKSSAVNSLKTVATGSLSTLLAINGTLS